MAAQDSTEFPTEEQTYYEDLISQWSAAFTGPTYEALFNQMLPKGDQLAVALQEAAQRIAALEAAGETVKSDGAVPEDGVLWEDEGVIHRSTLTAEGDQGVALLWLARIRSTAGETVYLSPEKRRSLAAALLKGI